MIIALFIVVMIITAVIFYKQGEMNKEKRILDFLSKYRIKATKVLEIYEGKDVDNLDSDDKYNVAKTLMRTRILWRFNKWCFLARCLKIFYGGKNDNC